MTGLFRRTGWGSPVVLALALLLGTGCPARIVVLHDPLSAEAHNALGIAYLKEGQYRAAERAFRRALRKKPGWYITYLNLGYVYARMQRWDRAYDMYAQALRAARGACPDCWNNLVYSALRRGRARPYHEAWVRIAIRQRGQPVFAYYHTGAELAGELGDCERFRYWFTRAALVATAQQWPKLYVLSRNYIRRCRGPAMEPGRVQPVLTRPHSERSGS